MTGWNLPPGVTESMIPGNRPEDIAWEKAWETLEKRLGRKPTEEEVEEHLESLSQPEYDWEAEREKRERDQ
jgi:hypothetical protein